MDVENKILARLEAFDASLEIAKRMTEEFAKDRGTEGFVTDELWKSMIDSAIDIWLNDEVVQ
jgi:hypothetical protein